MRPGLVILGGLFLVLGGAILGTVYLLPPASTTQQVATTVTPAPFPSTGSALVGPIRGADQSPSTFGISWRSTSPTRVTLFENASCLLGGSSPCTPKALTSWPAGTNGSWSTSGPIVYPVVLNVTGTGGGGGTIQASALDTYYVETPIPTLLEILIDVGAGVLLVVGGVLLFLGLFLRGDVYGSSPPLVSQSADDVEEIASSPPPPRR